MPITLPPDNKQEQDKELSATPWLDKATESSPAAKLLRKLAREKNKVGDVVQVYGSEDWIREHLDLFSRWPYTDFVKYCVNLPILCIDKLCNMPYNRMRKR